MDLARDLLDKPVIDRNRREMGRVDGIVLDVEEGRAPRVAAIEIGPSVLACRIAPPLGRIVAAIEDWCGVAAGRPTRIAVAEILDVAEKITVAPTATERGALNVERAMRRMLGGR